MDNKGLEVLDIISIMSFFLGLANYSENVDQSKMDNAVNGAVADIHKHLSVQDELIIEIRNMLKEKNGE